MRNFHEVQTKLQTLYTQILQESNQARYAEELWRYYGHLNTVQGSATRVRFVYDLCKLAHFDPEGKVVLDAGCGFGAVAIILRLMGTAAVHGIDIMTSRLETFRRIIEDYGLDSIYPKLASVDKMPYPDCSFDMVLSNEAISHYSDVDGFLREAARVLRPNGVLIIADGNNGANPHIVAHTHRLWERYENGPAGKVDGHVVRTPYLEMRVQIIRGVAPTLEESVAIELARRTSGMTRDKILEWLYKYQKTGELPSSWYHYGKCPRNPETGAVMEQLFHPRDLAAHIERFGFRARYYAYFGGAGGHSVVRLINTIGERFSPLTIRWARAYRIVAVRL